jgi:hypothetical protein
MGQINLTNCTVTVQNQNNTGTLPAKTHDISNLIAGNTDLTFVLNPKPNSKDSLIVILDGLVLRSASEDTEGDYLYDHATVTLTLLIDQIEDDSVLLAIYQE